MIWVGLFILLVAFVGCSPGPAPEDARREAERYAAARARMVEEQLTRPGRDIRSERVLAAMREVPRHEFVPKSHRPWAYEDYPLPIGHSQTISQPYIVAFMTEILDPKPTDRVLEIGTGSGYQAAVLSRLVSHVYSIEVLEPLAEQARESLQRIGYTNLTLKAGDGYLGWPEYAPFDSIIVTCAPDHIPAPLVRQLRDGGRMIIPVGELPDQELRLLEKVGDEVRERSVLAVRFVPMVRPK